MFLESIIRKYIILEYVSYYGLIYNKFFNCVTKNLKTHFYHLIIYCHIIVMTPC